MDEEKRARWLNRANQNELEEIGAPFVAPYSSVKLPEGMGGQPFDASPYLAVGGAANAVPNPFDLLQDYLMGPTKNFRRGIDTGISVGATEGMRALLEGDEYVPPSGIDYMAGDILGGIGAGAGGFKLARQGLSAAGLINPKNISRLGKVGLAATEGAGMGGLRGLFDPSLDAGTTASVGGAIGGILSGGANLGGYLGKLGIKYVANPKNFAKARALVDEAARKYGIPSVATARNIGNNFAEWLEVKAAQVSAAHQPLMDFLHSIDKGLDRFREEAADGLSKFKFYHANEDVGTWMQNKFDGYVFGELKDPASWRYNEIMKMGGKEFESIETKPLTDQLNEIMSKWQNVSSPQAQKVRNLIDRLMPSKDQQKFQHEMRMGRYDWKDLEEGGMNLRAENVDISLEELWKEATDMYPKKKWGWDDDDFLLVEVSGIMRGYIRKVASLHPEKDIGPRIGEMFKQADGLWSKHKKVLDSDFGKALMAIKKPENMVDNLAKDIYTVRAARETMGDDFVNGLAQQRIKNIMERSMVDLRNPDVRRAMGAEKQHGDEHFDYFKFADELRLAAGGGEGQIAEANAQRYWEVLLQTVPKEAREALDNFLAVAKAYAAPYRRLHPKKEMMAGGAEVASVPVALSSFERFGRIVLQFASGKTIAEKFITGGAKTNPLLGGTMPALAEGSKAATAGRILNRSAQGVGRQLQDPVPY